MRTTVDIPDPTYRKLKAKAAQQGSSVKRLILRGVDTLLSERRHKTAPVRLPLLRSKEPGTLDLSNEQIYEIIPFP